MKTKKLFGQGADVNVDVENDTVSIKHTSKHRPTKTNHAQTWHFLFKGISREQLLVSAVKHLVIAARKDFQGAENPDDWEGSRIDARQFC